MMVLMMTKIDREKTGRQHKHTYTPPALYIPGYYYIYKPNKLKTRKIKFSSVLNMRRTVSSVTVL